MAQCHRITHRETLHADGDIRFSRERIALAGGGTRSRVHVRHPGAVVILPVRGDGALLLLRQYRPVLARTILELPAGTRSPGEPVLPCAQRELREECGVAAATWTRLGVLYPMPGLCDEVQTVFLATALRDDPLPRDEDELIEVMAMMPCAVAEAVASGALRDAKSIAAIALARARGALP